MALAEALGQGRPSATDVTMIAAMLLAMVHPGGLSFRTVATSIDGRARGIVIASQFRLRLGRCFRRIAWIAALIPAVLLLVRQGLHDATRRARVQSEAGRR